MTDVLFLFLFGVKVENMLRNFILFAVLGLAVAKDVSNCAWGESYWCSSLRVARECGAVDHCISTVWTTTKLKQDSNDTCVFCENIIKDVKNFLTDQQTEDEIKQFLDSACSVIPDAELSKECQQTVDEDLPEIFQLIKIEMDPQMICAAIGLCSGLEDRVNHRKPAKPKNSIDQETEPKIKVSASVECVLCEFVMRELDQMLENNSTQQEILAALDKVCSVLPSSLSQDCDQFVNEYGPAVFALLAQELQPSQICSVLGLCSSSVVDLVQVDDCSACMTVINYVESLAKEKPTQEELEKILDKVCNFLPESLSGECTTLVNTYGPTIIQLILTETTPKEICEAIRMCTSEAKVLPKKTQLLGANECTWGPSYWCASRENAKLCQAEAHCEKHVWNSK